jgi:hypothetical protein
MLFAPTAVIVVHTTSHHRRRMATAKVIRQAEAEFLERFVKSDSI